MSVDVFGRQLDKSVIVKNRGLPGTSSIGFKLTVDDQYDMQNRKLCNVTDPEKPSDAATLNVLHKKLRGAVKTLRKEINDSNLLLVQGIEAAVRDIGKTLNISLETVKDLAVRNSNAISNVDSRLHAIENEHAQESSRRGAA